MLLYMAVRNVCTFGLLNDEVQLDCMCIAGRTRGHGAPPVLAYTAAAAAAVSIKMLEGESEYVRIKIGKKEKARVIRTPA